MVLVLVQVEIRGFQRSIIFENLKDWPLLGALHHFYQSCGLSAGPTMNPGSFLQALLLKWVLFTPPRGPVDGGRKLPLYPQFLV